MGQRCLEPIASVSDDRRVRRQSVGDLNLTVSDQAGMNGAPGELAVVTELPLAVAAGEVRARRAGGNVARRELA